MTTHRTTPLLCLDVELLTFRGSDRVLSCFSSVCVHFNSVRPVSRAVCPCSGHWALRPCTHQWSWQVRQTQNVDKDMRVDIQSNPVGFSTQLKFFHTNLKNVSPLQQKSVQFIKLRGKQAPFIRVYCNVLNRRNQFRTCAVTCSAG